MKVAPLRPVELAAGDDLEIKLANSSNWLAFLDLFLEFATNLAVAFRGPAATLWGYVCVRRLLRFGHPHLLRAMQPLRG